MRRYKPPALGKIVPNHELDATLSFSFAWLTTQKKYLFECFGSGSYRALGIKMPNDNRLYIVGFDFDFSSYKHE